MPRPTNTETNSPALPLSEYQGMLIGGNPSTATLVAAVQRGYRVLIDLRATDEIDVGARSLELADLGLRFVHIPVVCHEDLEIAAQRLHATLAADTGPFIVHCKSGNRVGAAFALRAHRHLGRSSNEALEIGLETGLCRLEPEVRALLGCSPK